MLDRFKCKEPISDELKMFNHCFVWIQYNKSCASQQICFGTQSKCYESYFPPLVNLCCAKLYIQYLPQRSTKTMYCFQILQVHKSEINNHTYLWGWADPQCFFTGPCWGFYPVEESCSQTWSGNQQGFSCLTMEIDSLVYKLTGTLLYQILFPSTF